MFDQASSLRELMRNVQKDNTLIAPNIKFQPKIPTVLAISGVPAKTILRSFDIMIFHKNKK